MSNKELIEEYRERLTMEEEPDQYEWVSMVENLCNILEKADQEIETLKNVYE